MISAPGATVRVAPQSLKTPPPVTVAWLWMMFPPDCRVTFEFVSQLKMPPPNSAWFGFR